jgi:methionyl-tRNA formyltransferase
MRVVYLGSGDIGIPSLRWLLSAPEVELVAVVTQPDRPAGRGLALTACAVKEVALSHQILTLQPSRIRDGGAVAQIRALEPDLLVVMAYGQILSRELLEVPKLGALNLHASLLPRHRGAAPVQAAVLAGDEKSGITVMWMDEGLDTGDILLMKECGIRPEETAGSLHDRLAGLAPEALAAAFDLLRAGRAPRTAQDAASAVYAPKLDRTMGRVDWSKSAVDIERSVRGLYPWPGCTAELELAGGRLIEVKIHRARVAEAPADPSRLRLPCRGGGVIELLEIQPAGRKRMGVDDFARGHRVLRATDRNS